MKVLFFIGEFNGGGAERVISILANKLVERDFDVEILKYHDTENSYETDERIIINSVEENTHTRTNTIKNLLWMKKHFSSNTDVVVSFLAPFNMLAIVANMFNKTPIIVADRNDPNRVPGNMIVRKLRNILYRKANAVVVQTEDNKEYFSFIKNIFVISNPLTIGDNVGLALRSEKENRIVSVGRLEEQKNQLMLIEAFYEIHKQYSDYSLTIYGEGSHRTILEQRINELNLNNCVFLPGEVKDIFEEIKDAKLFVLSSNYEGMPNALAEAMCLGLPCISTRVSGTKELIIDGENGLLIDVREKKSLIQKMKTVLSNNEVRNRLGSNAIMVYPKLDVETTTDRWEELFKKV